MTFLLLWIKWPKFIFAFWSLGYFLWCNIKKIILSERTAIWTPLLPWSFILFWCFLTAWLILNFKTSCGDAFWRLKARFTPSGASLSYYAVKLFLYLRLRVFLQFLSILIVLAKEAFRLFHDFSGFGDFVHFS